MAAEIVLKIPGFRDVPGGSPIVILGPNGSGKTRLAQAISQANKVSAVSAQRRTWIDDSLPVEEEQQLRSRIQNTENNWRSNSWQPTEEINFVLSELIRDHSSVLSRRNEAARASGERMDPVSDTKLIRLQDVWSRLFPKRKLEIEGFFPRVKRMDGSSPGTPYRAREMSDGERTVLYMAARVMTAANPVVLIDEPELHMHSRLAVQFWDEAETLRADCRFVYVTHDLNFAMSRRHAEVLVVRSSETIESVALDEVPSSIAAEVLGAATLPFYARRIFFYEGEPGKGFASEFFSVWFDDEETFAIPCGDCDAVCAAVSGLRIVGVAGAEVTGIVDRDYKPDAVLNNFAKGVTVLPVHEVESLLCDQDVVTCVAEHLQKPAAAVWQEFLNRLRDVFQGATVGKVIAERVRARVGDLLDGAFRGSQIDPDLQQTAANHRKDIAALDLPAKTTALFDEESKRVARALMNAGAEMLAILPGKHLLGLLSGVLGFKAVSELTSFILRVLHRRRADQDDAVRELGTRIEKALLKYLPARRS